MLVTENEFMLLNPDKTKMGCGIVKFIAFLQVSIKLTSLYIITVIRMLIYLLTQLTVVLYIL